VGVLALVHRPWWLAVPILMSLTRVAKSIWVRREGRGLLWLLNPAQFAGVWVIIAAIDLATFVGWVQARCSSPGCSAPDGQGTAPIGPAVGKAGG
jgi:hypothetical protein